MPALVHPLWLCGRQLANGYRQAEVRAWAERRLATALPRWPAGAGFAFGPDTQPGLQGTEMWLAVIWHLADLLGRSAELGYSPRGVHRTP